MPVKRRPNPLRADPTRTATIRRMFIARVRRSFKKLIVSIKRLLIDQDALGKIPPKPLAFNTVIIANQRQWAFKTDPEKVRQFRDWLKTEIGHDVTSIQEEQLWKQYIEEGFKKGAGRAFDDVKKGQRALATTDTSQAFLDGSKDQFLRSAFGQPVATEKVEILVSRAFTELEGVSDNMATTMTRTLADGLIQGKSPYDIAKDLERTTERLGITRAEVIARTEIIRAHAEGQLYAMEQMGVQEVGVQVEWSTAGDDRVCPQCASLEGDVMPIAEARGKLPLHPSCRCAWLPANVGETPSKGI